MKKVRMITEKNKKRSTLDNRSPPFAVLKNFNSILYKVKEGNNKYF